VSSVLFHCVHGVSLMLQIFLFAFDDLADEIFPAVAAGLHEQI
jgi:hypothetical protein